MADNDDAECPWCGSPSGYACEGEPMLCNICAGFKSKEDARVAAFEEDLPPI